MDGKNGSPSIVILVNAGIFESKSSAREMLKSGGVSINKNKITDMEYHIGIDDLLNQKYIFIQKGRNHYNLVIAK